jgi:hypothetical protein
MTTENSMNQRGKSARKWRDQKTHDGFQRVILWLPPDLSASVDHEAFKRMMPRSVAVEHILKDYFEPNK